MKIISYLRFPSIYQPLSMYAYRNMYTNSYEAKNRFNNLAVWLKSEWERDSHPTREGLCVRWDLKNVLRAELRWITPQTQTVELIYESICKIDFSKNFFSLCSVYVQPFNLWFKAFALLLLFFIAFPSLNHHRHHHIVARHSSMLSTPCLQI